MFLRFAVFAVIVLALVFTGLIDFGGLPWQSDDFRASGATVLLYVLWSLAGPGRRSADRLDPAGLAMYAVLLVSAVDGLLVRLTVIQGLYPVRYAGVLAFAAGSAVRLRATARGGIRAYRAGMILQLAGLPVGLGSIAGLAVGLVPGSLAAARSGLPLDGEST